MLVCPGPTEKEPGRAPDARTGLWKDLQAATGTGNGASSGPVNSGEREPRLCRLGRDLAIWVAVELKLKNTGPTALE
jgi:hypothetical protein